MFGQSHGTRRALVLVAIVVIGAVALPLASGIGAAQTEDDVIVETPESVDEGETVDGELEFDSIDDPDGVGSFTLNLTYNASAVSIDATADSETDFEIETENPETGVLRIVGYIAAETGPNGSGALAELEITGENTNSETDITVDSIEQFTNADGDELDVESDSTDTIAVSTTQSDDDGDEDEDDDDGGGGGGGGGILPPLTDDSEESDDTTDEESEETDDSTDDTTDEESEETEDSTDEESDDSIPGFGIPIALVALLGAALLATYRHNS